MSYYSPQVLRAEENVVMLDIGVNYAADIMQILKPQKYLLDDMFYYARDGALISTLVELANMIQTVPQRLFLG